MEALQIECELAGPWCPPAQGLHLDGLLAWVLVQDALASGAKVDNYQDVIADLPLDRHASGVWCASMFTPVGWMGQERRYLTAKTPVEDMIRNIGIGCVSTKGGSVIDTVRGPAKNGQTYITVEHVRGLRAWCVGDGQAIADLLERVPGVGVKTRLGLGSLVESADGSRWRITECEEARELWKRRASPVKLIEDSHQSIGAWKSPYWHGAEVIWRPNPIRIKDQSVEHA